MKRMHDQRGQAFLLAMLALVIGMLVVTPFLGLVGTNIMGSQHYRDNLFAIYACDAGIEYGIWGLMSGTAVVTETEPWTANFPLNQHDVAVTVSYASSSLYQITATATDNDGLVTTRMAMVQAGGTTWTNDGNISGDTVGDVLVDGEADIGNGVTVDGSVYGTEDVILYQNAEVTGDIVAEGNVTVSTNGTIGGDIYTHGDITLGNNTIVGSLDVGGNVITTGDVTVQNNTTIWGDIYLVGSGTQLLTIFNNSIIEGNVYIIGDITTSISISNNAYISGAVYYVGPVSVSNPANVLGGVFQNYTGYIPDAPDWPTPPDSGDGSIVGLE